MNADLIQRWHEVEPLIDQLLELPATEQTDWLRRHCKDATLQEIIGRALDYTPSVDALERGIAQWLPAPLDIALDELPAIDGYRILRFVGAGGMASVFEAERELPGGPQKVALKLLRIDVHDADERLRFLREQHILARLQHPHVAQLLDAGFSPTGTPYLTLEFVTGDNLVKHCQKQKVEARGRLALFLDMCRAVEYAHRNLIVHRDLKPNNVLVGQDGCVKLVDFGIAKLLTDENESERTRTETRRLTRSYAAPEQIAGDATTTSIDIYALGVLLAELLSDLHPRKIDRFTDRKTPVFEEGALRRKLGVDLHAIVREAMQADPAQRYASVTALREDVERYLTGKPLQARADTLAYRSFTFVKRNVLAVCVTSAIVVTLAAATAISLYESHLARRAAQEARAHAVAAEAEARREDALKSFLEGLFDNVSHEAVASSKILLATGQQRADRDFTGQPALRIEILALIGDLERRSGHPDQAQKPLEEAAALAETDFGATDRRTLHVEYLLAKVADELGRFRSGRARLQGAIEAFESGPNRESPEEVQALSWLAGLDERLGESKKAIDIGEKSVALARRVLPGDSEALTESAMNLGWILMDAGYPGRAEPLLREALARTRQRLGETHPDVADAAMLLTTALVQLGRYDESEGLMRSALDIDEAAYEGPNVHIAGDFNNLANVLMFEDKFAEADAFYTKSLAVDRTLSPASPLNEVVTLGHLAHLRFVQGHYADAEKLLRDAMARKKVLLGADYDDYGRSYDDACLAEILLAEGHVSEAQVVADGALDEVKRQRRDIHTDMAFALTTDAAVAAAGGSDERAVTLAGEAVAIYDSQMDQGSEKAVRARLLFGEILQRIDRSQEAKRQLESALEGAESMAPRTASLVAHIEADLALTEISLGDHASADQLRKNAKALLAETGSEPNRERDVTFHLLAAPNTLGQGVLQRRGLGAR